MEIEGVKTEKIWYKHYRYVDFNETLKRIEKISQLKALLNANKKNTYPYKRGGKTYWTPTCKGGFTECYIVDENENTFMGWADCSLDDNFVYSVGRSMALDMAIKKMRQHHELPF